MWSQVLGANSHQHPTYAIITEEGVRFTKGKLDYQVEINVPLTNVVQYEIDYSKVDLRKPKAMSKVVSTKA